MLKNIARFLSSSIGSSITIKKIANYLVSAGRKVSANTVSDYVSALVEPYLFYSADRFDISGKELMKTNKKMYIADLGLRNYLVSKRQYDLGFSIENIVFLELKRRKYNVSIGKIGDMEVDFIAAKNGIIKYYQVTADMKNEAIFEREMKPLKKIRDSYEKTILTLDTFSVGCYEGINVVYLIDWLTEV